MILVHQHTVRALHTRGGHALGVSQGGLGTLLECSKRTVRRWVAGSTSIDPDPESFPRHP